MASSNSNQFSRVIDFKQKSRDDNRHTALNVSLKDQTQGLQLHV